MYSLKKGKENEEDIKDITLTCIPGIVCSAKSNQKKKKQRRRGI